MDLRDGIITDWDESISAVGLENSSARIWPAGTVLMGMYGLGTAGRLGMLAHPAACNQAVCALVADPDRCDPRWLFYRLKVDRARIEQSTNGAVQQNISATAIRTYAYAVPPLEEQHAIAEVLGALDDKIAANTKLAHGSRELAQVAFAFAMTAGNITRPLLSLAELVTRGVSPAYTDAETESMTVVNQKCVRGGRVSLNQARRTELRVTSSAKVLRPGDVLVNSTGQGTLGRVGIWTGKVTATADSHVSIVRFDANEVDKTCGAFGMLAAEPTITALGEGSTGQTELSRQALNALEVHLPAEHQQQSLGRQLAGHLAAENAWMNENRTLATLRDTFLPQLMSGKLRVRDAERTVSEVL